jgi:hypothetical protein
MQPPGYPLQVRSPHIPPLAGFFATIPCPLAQVNDHPMFFWAIVHLILITFVLRKINYYETPILSTGLLCYLLQLQCAKRRNLETIFH